MRDSECMNSGVYHRRQIMILVLDNYRDDVIMEVELSRWIYLMFDENFIRDSLN